MCHPAPAVQTPGRERRMLGAHELSTRSCRVRPEWAGGGDHVRAGRATVLVLEAAERPGGAVASEELTLPGFRHDTFSSVYPAAAASPVFARLPLRATRPALDPSRGRASRTRCPTAAPVALYRDLDRRRRPRPRATQVTASAGTRSPRRTCAISTRSCTRCSARFPPVAGSLRLAAGLGPRGALDFTRLLLMPAQALGEELFDGRRRRAPGCTARRCTPTCRRSAPGARSRPPT